VCITGTHVWMTWRASARFSCVVDDVVRSCTLCGGCCGQHNRYTTMSHIVVDDAASTGIVKDVASTGTMRASGTTATLRGV
jgi:hypothetical protein